MKYYFKNPANTAPLLVLAVFLLLYSSRLIDTALLTRENEYVAVIVLQLVIFLMPSAFYIRALGLESQDSASRSSAPVTCFCSFRG